MLVAFFQGQGQRLEVHARQTRDRVIAVRNDHVSTESEERVDVVQDGTQVRRHEAAMPTELSEVLVQQVHAVVEPRPLAGAHVLQIEGELGSILVRLALGLVHDRGQGAHEFDRVPEGDIPKVADRVNGLSGPPDHNLKKKKKDANARTILPSRFGAISRQRFKFEQQQSHL